MLNLGWIRYFCCCYLMVSLCCSERFFTCLYCDDDNRFIANTTSLITPTLDHSIENRTIKTENLTIEVLSTILGAYGHYFPKINDLLLEISILESKMKPRSNKKTSHNILSHHQHTKEIDQQMKTLGSSIFGILRNSRSFRTNQFLAYNKRLLQSSIFTVSDMSVTSKFCDWSSTYFQSNLSSTPLPDVALSSSSSSSVSLSNSSKYYTPPKVLKTAVCLVGTTRTLLRADVKSSLLYRFYAGWGIDNLYTFAVLSHHLITHNRTLEKLIRDELLEIKNEKSLNSSPKHHHNKKSDNSRHLEEMTSKEEILHEKVAIYEFLKRLNTVAVEWYQPLQNRTCMESHLEMQLRQWSQCLGLIEDYEKKQNAKFDVVVKLRPDDLWYGPMVPYCSLDVANTVYIARQKDRWSDQWFSLPRKLANPILDLIHSKIQPICFNDSTTSTSTIYSVIIDPSKLHFESLIFKHFEQIAKKAQIKIIPLSLPRILSRPNVASTVGVGKQNDIIEKCAHFLWSVPKLQCTRTVKGKDRISA